MISKDAQKIHTALLSVVSNTLLTLLKLLVGLLTGSVSVLSEAIHSGMDLLAAVMAWAAVKASGKPADKRHPFGHGKFENLSGSIEALLIFAAAGYIIYESVKKLMVPEPVEKLPWGIAVMAFSCLVNILVSMRLFKVGRRTDSIALITDAWHLRTDIYTSFGVFAGLLIIEAGERIFPGRHFHWIDPVAALFVTALILRAAWRLTIQSGRDLLDVSLPAEEEELIRRHIRDMAPQVKGYHRLKTRKSGPRRHVEFHMLVDGNMSVNRSHELTDQLQEAIQEHYPDTDVTIHIEPEKGRTPAP
jgi:cation diffusion facilitator family transporter